MLRTWRRRFDSFSLALQHEHNVHLRVLKLIPLAANPILIEGVRAVEILAVLFQRCEVLCEDRRAARFALVIVVLFLAVACLLR